MKKFAVIALAAVLSMTMLTGCGIPINENSQKAKKSKLEDIAWDLHLVKDVVIAVLIGIIVGHMNGIETIAAVFTGMLMLIALVHIDCEIHMTVGRKR